jgi:hypothetical protein
MHLAMDLGSSQAYSTWLVISLPSPKKNTTSIKHFKGELFWWSGGLIIGCLDLGVSSSLGSPGKKAPPKQGNGMMSFALPLSEFLHHWSWSVFA